MGFVVGGGECASTRRGASSFWEVRALRSSAAGSMMCEAPARLAGRWPNWAAGSAMPVVSGRVRKRRLARATSRVVRPGTSAATALERTDDAWWEDLSVADRVRVAFRLTSSRACMVGGKTRLAKDLRALVRRVRRSRRAVSSSSARTRSRCSVGSARPMISRSGSTPYQRTRRERRGAAGVRSAGSRAPYRGSFRPGVVYQIGLPPLRIDILTAIDGVGAVEQAVLRVEVDEAHERPPTLLRLLWRAS